MSGPITYIKTGFTTDKIPDLTGKTAIVTGGNAGLGYETVLELTKKGAKVFMACRSEERARASIDKIHQITGKQSVEFLLLDLQDMKQTKAAALAFLAKDIPLDILVNNAGIMACPFALTKDGIETQMGTNHVGHFVFTTNLIPALKRAAPSRVVIVASHAYVFAPDYGIDFDKINVESQGSSWMRYGQSKLANILFARSLHKRFKDSGIFSYSLHPGVVHTELMRGPVNLYGLSSVLSVVSWMASWLKGILVLQADQGALTQLYLATSPDVLNEEHSGKYFIPFGKEPSECKPIAKDDDLADKLWEWSEKMVAEKL
ncbi:hypothetical protein BASA50_006696 [Batrachochytrium salamandrivorans]|uniref:NAD(P)-binding protein n=1 Tax=Batrachochytrium salamandrivorans TaxID=1357716 RepID=A0ABQ8F9G2_9FUNG|nr:hypothetical protein BASA62_001296 [Batrachochytrium salamandrivorans]KAH6579420.1 hypothetical protein BASA60_003270 [Batrachochytrium salamandrivorans]KAH6594449.1 hypothetical protein BASA50_006696 [Batrachochytrium salamandrivorans]KAH6594967.1 hypothetical protein BASA61_003903 [Batrachochytrium salamandrivorans]KAH6602868.1 hypothetical protein BASA61_000688 [Batrachochytrium salamandrivorans]